VSLALIKVGEDRLGATDTFTTPEGVQAVYSSRARALVDAVYDWSRFGSLPRAYAWIREEIGRERNMAKEITRAAIKYGNVSTLRRLGKLFDIENVSPSLLKRIERALPKTTAQIAWCPTRAKRGTIDKRWGVVFNE
jgi:predicted transcriptional regulator of viral defense system